MKKLRDENLATEMPSKVELSPPNEEPTVHTDISTQATNHVEFRRIATNSHLQQIQAVILAVKWFEHKTLFNIQYTMCVLYRT